VATSLLDPRDPLAPAATEQPGAVAPLVSAARPIPAAEPVPAAESVPAAPRRRPVAVVVLGAGGMLQAVALVAVALTSLTGMLAAEHRAPDAVIAAVLVALATWTVLSAATGAAVLDGAGRRALVALGAAEVVVVAGLLVVAATTSLLDGVTGDLPAPALALLGLSVPLGRLLLAGAPSTVAWIEAGPPVRERRADPVVAHRRLCGATLAVIGLALGAVALLGPTAAPGGAPATAATSAH
jgi:hypothetical protein